MVQGLNPPTYVQCTLFSTSDMLQKLVPICVFNQQDHFTNINEDVISIGLTQNLLFASVVLHQCLEFGKNGICA